MILLETPDDKEPLQKWEENQIKHFPKQKSSLIRSTRMVKTQTLQSNLNQELHFWNFQQVFVNILYPLRNVSMAFCK